MATVTLNVSGQKFYNPKWPKGGRKAESDFEDSEDSSDEETAGAASTSTEWRTVEETVDTVFNWKKPLWEFENKIQKTLNVWVWYVEDIDGTLKRTLKRFEMNVKTVSTRVWYAQYVYGTFTFVCLCMNPLGE